MFENKIYVIDLPTPPSVNALWRISGRRMYKSKKYREFIDLCREVVEFDFPTVDYPFNIEILIRRPSKRRMDIDNRAKAVMDILEELKIISDDCLANQINMMWSEDVENCQVTISKSPLN